MSETQAALRKLGIAVLAQAVRDARAGDAEAVAWLTDADSVEHWCRCADFEPRNFASRAARALREERAA